MPARVGLRVALLTCVALGVPVAPALGQSFEPSAASLPPLTAETVGCPETAGVAEPAPSADVTVGDCRWLVVSEGTTDGKPWRVVAMAVGGELWWWLDLENETTGSMVLERTPIISAGMSSDPHVAYGVVGPQVSRVLLETTGADVDLTIVPLTRIGVEAGAFGEPVPPGTEVEWFVALAADGSELDRLVGPAAAPWASQEPAAIAPAASEPGLLDVLAKRLTSFPTMVWPDSPAPGSVAGFVPAAREQLWDSASEGLRIPLHLRFVEARCESDGQGVALVFEEVRPPYLSRTYAYAVRGSMPTSEDDAWGGGHGVSSVLTDPEFIHLMGTDTVECP